MQNVSEGDNMHEMYNPDFWEKLEKVINLSSVELAEGVVNVNTLTELMRTTKELKLNSGLSVIPYDNKYDATYSLCDKNKSTYVPKG